MPDIVEIALDTITDFLDFEKLACEVLHQRGFPDIQPLGGVADSGQDAVVERFYIREGKRIRLVFQVTTQETIESKLKDTITRLDEAEVEYTGLCLVTSRELTTARQQKLVQTANESDVLLTIIERKTIALVLSDFVNGVFHRHFPDPEKQLDIARAARKTESIDQERLLNMAMAFTGIVEADRARRSVLRELTLVLLVSTTPPPASARELVDMHRKLLPSADGLQVDQVDTALNYWVQQGLVTRKTAGRFAPTEAAIERSEVAAMHWARHGSALASDIVDSVEEAVGRELDSTIRGLVERNAVDAVSDLFRLFGLEMTSQLLGDQSRRQAQVGSHEALNTTIRRNLPEGIGEVVAASLGDILAAPNDEQANILSALALGYMGASLVQVDPAVRELQVTRIRNKAFVIDTDFLLDCIVSHQPRQSGSIALVRKLTEMGAKVLVPDVCISEAADHASIARRTVDYFGDSIFGLSERHAAERINNMFARGWYFRCLQEGRVPFAEYHLNYYESTGPHEFMTEVVRSVLPEDVEVGEIAELLRVDVDYEAVEELTAVLATLLAQSRKSQYRTPEEVDALARTDARLYMAAAAAASPTAQAGRRALGRGCYLITSSTRFIRATGQAFGQADEVSARPETLTGLMRLVGQSDVTARDFVALFDNPLLQASVANAWPDLEDLLSAGISLRNKSQARLTWDLEDGLHQRIAAVKATEETADQLETDDARRAVDKSVLELLEDSRDRGYGPMDHAGALLRAVEPLRAENARLTEELDALGERFATLESEIDFFGRRRQRYLRSVARGQRKPNPR